MAGARTTHSKRRSRLTGAVHAVRRSAPSRRRAVPALAIENFPGAILVTGRKGQLTHLNSAASALSGWTQTSIRGHTLGELLIPRDGTSRKADSKRTRTSAANLTPARPARCWLLQPSGRRISVRIRALGADAAGGSDAGQLILLERSKASAVRPSPMGALVSLLRRDMPFRTVFGGSNFGVALTDVRGRFLRVNDALCSLTGHSRAQLQRTRLEALIHSEDQNAAKRARQPSEGLIAHQGDKQFRRKDGHTVWLRVSLTPLRDGAGKPTYFLTGLQDISALKTATENLRESEERFRSAFNASAIGMGLVSPAGKYLRVNRALCEFFGLEENALIGLDIAEFNEPDEYATIVERRQQMIDGLMPRYFSYEKRFLHKSGRTLWGHLTVALVKDQADRPAYFVILIQDTTERHNAEITLRESEQRLRALVEGLPVLMDAFDEDGVIVAWNKECERVTGYRAEEIIGNPHAIEWLYPDPDYRAAMLDDAQKYSMQAYRNRAWDLRTKDGKIRTVAWSNVGADVQIPGWKEWGIGIDITERRRLELALQQASEYEQRRLGQEMHDGLGQELAALALLAYSLASKPDLADDPVRQELDRLAQIARQAVQSGRAIAHGLAPLDESEGDLIEALRRMTQHHLAEVSGTQVVLEEQLSAELAIPATARSHLYRIAQEALNNAIRHAKAKSVSMELVVTPRLVRLTISDDGKGFTARAERSVGMGLKTMQNRATAIGATLSIRTESEAGTSITVECLNLSATAENVAEPPAQHAAERGSKSSDRKRH
jgi:PAS domain S-box-containing protein